MNDISNRLPWKRGGTGLMTTTTTTTETLPDWLRRLIRESGCSANEIARRAGVSPSTVSRFIAAETSLTLDVAEKIRAAITPSRRS